ncbi:MAG: type II CAAX endopeptidase family protein [Pirellulaceae bacterium]
MPAILAFPPRNGRDETTENALCYRAGKLRRHSIGGWHIEGKEMRVNLSDSGPSPDGPTQLPQSSSNFLWIVVAVTFPSTVTWLYFVVLADVQPIAQASYAVGKMMQFAMPVIWLVLVAREKVRLPQLKSNAYRLGLLFGVGVALTMIVLFELAFLGQPWFSSAESEIGTKISQMGVNTLPRFVMLALFYAAFHSLMEEYYWRWFVFRRLMPSWNTGLAILVSSLGFMAHHVILLAQYFGPTAPFTYIAAVGVAIGGAFWAWLYTRCDSLGPSWLSHAMIDAAIFVIGYRIAFA